MRLYFGSGSSETLLFTDAIGTKSHVLDHIWASILENWSDQRLCCSLIDWNTGLDKQKISA